MSLPTIPPWTQKELANPAPAGGRHSQIIKIAFALRSRGWDAHSIFYCLRPNYASDVTDSEILNVIDWAAKGSFGENPKDKAGGPIALKRPKKLASPEEHSAIADHFLRGFTCEEADLWEASPYRPGENWTKDALLLVSHAFIPHEYVNIVTAFAKDGQKTRPIGYGTTAIQEQLLQKIAKSSLPVSKAGAWIRINPTDGGGIADKNVTAYRFALLEFDQLPQKMQLALFARLPLPIFAILTSGGRSLHAWLRLKAGSFGDYRGMVDALFQRLQPLGIDVANRNPSRLSRLPGVQRILGASGDGRQSLLYINPDVKEWRPIL